MRRNSQHPQLSSELSVECSALTNNLPVTRQLLCALAHWQLESAIHEYIRSLASSLSDPAAAPRAISLFSQAMTVANYRWGRKVKLVAAASVAIARRESRRPDDILAIASIIDEPPSVVSRTFSALVALVDLSLPITDPASHFPTNLSSQRRPKNERPSSSKKINQEVLSRLLQHQGTFGEDDSDWIGGIGQFAFSDEDDNSHEEEHASDRHSGDGSGKISGINSNRSATCGQILCPPPNTDDRVFLITWE